MTLPRIVPLEFNPYANPALTVRFDGGGEPWHGLPFETVAQAEAYRATLYPCACCGKLHRYGSLAAQKCDLAMVKVGAS